MVSADEAPVVPLFIKLSKCTTNFTMLAAKPGRCLADTSTSKEKAENGVGRTF